MKIGINSIGNMINNNEVNGIKTKDKGFTDIFKEMLYEANDLKKESDQMTTDFLAGKADNIHEVMITAQKAEIAISFVAEVRNRFMEAYQEFARMQL